MLAGHIPQCFARCKRRGCASVFPRLNLRSIAKRCVSKGEAAQIVAAPWFETHAFGVLFTMRPGKGAVALLEAAAARC
jgi:hypothetical protein